MTTVCCVMTVSVFLRRRRGVTTWRPNVGPNGPWPTERYWRRPSRIRTVGDRSRSTEEAVLGNGERRSSRNVDDGLLRHDRIGLPAQTSRCYTYPTLCWKGIRVSPKIRVLRSRTFIQTLDIENFATALRSPQVLPTQVDGQCDKLVTVVGHEFITLTVDICVQHGGRKEPLRAGLSAAAETCFKTVTLRNHTS